MAKDTYLKGKQLIDQFPPEFSLDFHKLICRACISPAKYSVHFFILLIMHTYPPELRESLAGGEILQSPSLLP